MIKRAVSFVELLIAIVVIALAMFPIMSLVSTSHGDSRSTLEEVIASNLASEAIEAVQSLPLKLVPMNVDTEIVAGTFAVAEAAGYTVGLATPPVGFKRFLKTEAVSIESVVPSDLQQGIKDRAASASVIIKIKARVEWSTRGRPESVQLVTARGYF
ncbi:MAG: hypothetical protein HQM10_11425 [Candidatus Riflebacteria bacterium]|nr:hypothetical protein [Candidatus Riflebacteria bacterium]